MKNIYICGPTVYSSPHIGNLRPMVTFDIYRRSIEFLGEKVNMINNITDIDDKIISEVVAKEITEEEVAAKYTSEYMKLLEDMNVIKPELMPGVVENMSKSIILIEELVNNHFAYVVDENVYFDVSTISDYGKLSNRSVKDVIEPGSGKKNPADFALWKKTFEGKQFHSPWGNGRPGWHLECVTNIFQATNGKGVHIHSGGMDLKFPHHENERAIFKALTGKEISAEWCHTGQININDQKMSKSEGNIISAFEFNKLYGYDTLRYILLTTTVTGPIDLSEQIIEAAVKHQTKLSKTFFKAQAFAIEEYKSDRINDFAQALKEFKFSKAMRILNETTKEFNRENKAKPAADVIAMVKIIGYRFSNIILSEEEKDSFNRLEQYREDKQFSDADILYKKMQEKGLV